MAAYASFPKERKTVPRSVPLVSQSSAKKAQGDMAFNHSAVYRKKSFYDSIYGPCLARVWGERRGVEFVIMSHSNSSGLTLPVSRVKTIMRSSPDVDNIAPEALHIVTMATVRIKNRMI